jgi:hypothetical protein
VQDPDLEREHAARERMAEVAVVLTTAQREVVERAIREHGRIRGWTWHAVNHVQLVGVSKWEREAYGNECRTLSDTSQKRLIVKHAAAKRR